MTTVYTASVKPKKEKPSIVRYQGFLVGFCMVHSEFECTDLNVHPTFDLASDEVKSRIDTAKENSPLVVGLILETTRKGDDITIAMYARSNRDGNYQCIETLETNYLKESTP